MWSSRFLGFHILWIVVSPNASFAQEWALEADIEQRGAAEVRDTPLLAYFGPIFLSRS